MNPELITPLPKHVLGQISFSKNPLCTINKSTIHGMGLYAQQEILKGNLLLRLDGQLIPWKDFKYNDSPVAEWNALKGDVLLFRSNRTQYSYINHSRTPNVEVRQINSSVEVYAISDIKAGGEILLDYRNEPLPEEYIDSHGSTFL